MFVFSYLNEKVVIFEHQHMLQWFPQEHYFTVLNVRV